MPESLRIVFMGTPEFAVASLQSLLNSKHEIVGVITAPDKPAGRGKKIKSPPVKIFADEHGLTVLQPAKLKDPEFLNTLRSLRADLQFVVAFRMLPEEVWKMPPLGTINLHASLLPDYRGAAPINWAVINGDTQTGVTTFFIEQDIDTGKIIYKSKVEIGPDMTAGELHDILMSEGAKLVVKTADAIAAGEYPTISQNEITGDKQWNAAPKIFKEDCRLDWSKSLKDIRNLVRGLCPYPAAWTELQMGEERQLLKIFRISTELRDHNYETGNIITDGKSWLKIATHEGFAEILELQLAGKKRMNIQELLRGYKFDTQAKVV